VETKTKRDCHSEITNAIIADLEKGVRPWVKPWESGTSTPCRPMRITGDPYRGINILLLWSAAHHHGYQGKHWLTYQQAQQLGGHVRKGEKSTTVVYAGALMRTERNDNGEEEEKSIPFLKAYSVFNVDQTDGLPGQYQPPAQVPTVKHDNALHPIADEFVGNTNADVQHGGDRAYYSPLQDRIHLPNLDRFRDSDSYYAVLLHELIHWTMRDARCPRKFRPTTFGSTNYAREELIAELGAAFLCADLQVALTPRSDHAEYIAGWLEVLRNDKRAIFQAAATAQRATDFLHSLQRSDSKIVSIHQTV
jgi:antirestriction protein ArdC